jgi:hypothetical protein
LSDQLHERQDHVVYALTIALVVVALSLGIDYQLSTSARYASPLARGGPQLGSSWSALLIACAIYALFRLIRPFSFASPAGQVPGGAFYWIGSVIVTLVGAAATTVLAWAVLHPPIMTHYRAAGLAVSLAMIAGFLLIEAAIVRQHSVGTVRPPYLDGGLISALLIAPACLTWFLSVAPRSGLGIFIESLFRSDSWRLALPFLLASGIFLLWLITTVLRRKLRGRPAYRAATGALWIFGAFGYAMLAVAARRSSEGGLLYDLWSYSYIQPGFLLSVLIFLWLAVAVGMYLVQRKWRAD